MRWRLLWSSYVIAAAFATLAQAEPIDFAQIDFAQIEDVEVLSLTELLERPVLAASRYAQKPSDSPRLVSSVDRDMIERLGYRTIGEALRGMRGVYLTNDRNYSHLGVRGFGVPGDYNARISLSIDNHLINDAIYGQATPGAEIGLPMLAIDRIEMLRGGAWSVYGQNAMLGAIQVITATGASRPGVRVTSTTSASAETFHDEANRPALSPRAQDVSASYGAVRGGVDVFAAATYRYDVGLPAIYMPELATADENCVDARGQPKVCDGIVEGNDGEELAAAYLAVRSRRWALHALASHRRKQTPTAAYGSLIGDPVETFDDRLYADATYTSKREHTDAEARVAADYYGYHGSYPFEDPRDGFPDLPSDRTVSRDSARGLWLTSELRGRYRRTRYGEHLSDLELATGGQLGVAYTRQDSYNDRPEGVDAFVERKDRTRMAALMVHAGGRAFGHLVGYAAARADYYPDSFGVTVNPQGGLVLDGGTLGRVRVSIARGFRAPNVFELYYVDDGPRRLNTELGPERSVTRELSIERYLGAHARLLAIAYLQRMSDLIVLTPELVFANMGRVTTRGIELELEARWDAVQLRASLTRQRARDQEDQRPVNSPRSLATLSMLLPIGQRTSVAFESRYIGSRFSFDGSAVPPAFVSDAAITMRDVIDRLDVTLGAHNLFDQRTADPGGEEHRAAQIPNDPRTVWLRLSAELGR